tara:strand:+ start:395 stop:1051 length:657 start_codon:yes stop_codon:yes gene_type:complete
MYFTDALEPSINVAISAYKDGRLIDQRLSHNVFTNTGRTWLSRLVGSSDYAQEPPTPHTHDKIAYIGFGCGGALQTNADFAKGQTELVTVTALQDPVPISIDGDQRLYLKQVDNQTSSSTYFPGDFRTRFIVNIAESEISFTGNKTRVSNRLVGTSVPITEAGLYLSSANPRFTHELDPASAIESDPAGPNKLVAYNIFDPIHVTPNVILRVEWELRF